MKIEYTLRDGGLVSQCELRDRDELERRFPTRKMALVTQTGIAYLSSSWQEPGKLHLILEEALQTPAILVYEFDLTPGSMDVLRKIMVALQGRDGSIPPPCGSGGSSGGSVQPFALPPTRLDREGQGIHGFPPIRTGPRLKN